MHGHKEIAILAIDQEQGWVLARLLECRAQILGRTHRFVVHFLDDVARLDASCRGNIGIKRYGLYSNGRGVQCPGQSISSRCSLVDVDRSHESCWFFKAGGPLAAP